jgi:hypothetical protein
MLFTIKNNPRIADLLVTLGEQNSTIRLSNSLYNFLVGRVIRYMDGPAVTGTIFFDCFCESPEKTKDEKIRFWYRRNQSYFSRTPAGTDAL